MAPTTLRRSGAYRRTHEQIHPAPHVWRRMCGKCQKPIDSAQGQKRHPILGYLCHSCGRAK